MTQIQEKRSRRDSLLAHMGNPAEALKIKQTLKINEMPTEIEPEIVPEARRVLSPRSRVFIKGFVGPAAIDLDTARERYQDLAKKR